MDQKRRATAIILISATFGIVAFSAAWIGPVLASMFFIEQTVPHEESLRLSDCRVERAAGDQLCVSLVVAWGVDDSPVIVLNELQINQVSQRSITGLRIYVNGTSVDSVQTPAYQLKKGDTALVNLVLPDGNVTFGSRQDEAHLSVAVLTPRALYYREAEIPK